MIVGKFKAISPSYPAEHHNSDRRTIRQREKPQSAVYWLGFMMHRMEKYKWEATMFGNLPAILY